ncbi:hypothetical protein AJ88_47685 [Mesorhizobium amorphae CCBAU 01583]|nr:hypothetical protein AJ88_47685 [Mesorhizobium amorphae CCBAU 01583]
MLTPAITPAIEANSTGAPNQRKLPQTRPKQIAQHQRYPLRIGKWWEAAQESAHLDLGRALLKVDVMMAIYLVQRLGRHAERCELVLPVDF